MLLITEIRDEFLSLFMFRNSLCLPLPKAEFIPERAVFEIIYY